MTFFAIGVALLVAIAWLTLSPAWRATAVPSAGTALALTLIREQLSTLDREHAEGQIDAAQHRQLRLELQHRALEEGMGPTAPAAPSGRSRKAIVGIALAVPLFAIGVYVAIGNPAGLEAEPASPLASARSAQRATPASEPEVTPEAINAMLATLEERLQTSSGNGLNELKGWTMLGRSYAAMQRFGDADRAYRRALALEPEDAQLLADRADVLAMAQGQRLAGEPAQLVAKALSIDPSNLKALALAGSGAFERKDYAAARRYWQQARALAPDGSDLSTGLERSLDDARIAAGEAPARAPDAAIASASASASTAASAVAAHVSGRVALAPSLLGKAAPTDTVFVFARAAQGPRMPLAIVRRAVADLPFDFTLDDTQAMSPQMKLSGFDRVVVGARVSRSGSAMPQAGDLHGESAAVTTRTDGLAVVIDTVQP